MENIRNNIFETNSSSVHTIVIPKSAVIDVNGLKLPKKIDLSSEMYYGWEWKRYNCLEDKLSYLVAAINSLDDNNATFLNILEKYLKELGTEEFIINTHSFIEYGYHCYEFVEFVLSDISRLHRYLFSEDSIVLTGNDNSDPPLDYEILEDDVTAINTNVDVFTKGN